MGGILQGQHPPTPFPSSQARDGNSTVPSFLELGSNNPARKEAQKIGEILVDLEILDHVLRHVEQG